MWQTAAAFTAIILLGGLYETWALASNHRPITELVKRYTHLSIILGGAGFTLLGYVLGTGGN